MNENGTFATDAFDTSAMTSALDKPKENDANGSVDQEDTSIPIMTKEEQTAADAARARAHNWAEPTPYDYTSYKQPTKEELEAMNKNARSKPLWLSNAAKYEWIDEYGEVGPPIPELENELFGDEYVTTMGKKFDVLGEYQVSVEAGQKIRPISSFSDAGLHPIMAENVRLSHYKSPTPVQAYTIPAVLLGYDVVAVSQTGSGKTGAYLIPILSRLMGKSKRLRSVRPALQNTEGRPDRVRAEPLVIIVCPTRELACQIFDDARRFCYRTQLRPCVVYGGGPVGLQAEELGRGCDILIGTPGRLCDFMDKPHILSFSRVKFTIIDEADELLQEDWNEQIGKIIGGGDNTGDDDHTYMMFSATFPKAARELAAQYMNDDHIFITVGRIGSTHTNIKQKIVWTDDNLKRQALYDLLFAMPPARTLIFVNSKHQADLLDDYLYNRQLPSTSIHSDRTQREREDAIRAFRRGQAPILVATGITARGIDVKDVMHVINFELPTVAHGGINEYVHRIGRTARIGNEGLATSFYNDKDEPLAVSLVKVLLENKQEIPEFLQQHIPEGDITWSEEEDNDVANNIKDPSMNNPWGTDGKSGFQAENGDGGVELGFTTDTQAGDANPHEAVW